MKAYPIEFLKQAIGIYAGLGNQACLAFAIACVSESIDRRIDNELGIVVSEEERNEYFKQRLKSKVIRRTLTDYIKEGYPGFTSVDYALMTLDCYDKLGLREVYTAHKNSDSKEPFRDSLSEDDLRKVVELESFIARYLGRGLSIAEAFESYFPENRKLVGSRA